MQELRNAIYFCKDFWERYKAAVEKGNHKAWNAVGSQAKNSAKPTHLSSFLLRAKALYRQSSVIDAPLPEDIAKELEYATWLSERMAEIIEKAVFKAIDDRDAKRELVQKLEEKGKVVLICPKCKRETKKHLDYCPTCGKKQVF